MCVYRSDHHGEKTEKTSKGTAEKTDDGSLNLKDRLDSGLFEQLSGMKKDCLKNRNKSRSRNACRSLRKRKKKKNKSFEELLNDSQLKWSDYK